MRRSHVGLALLLSVPVSVLPAQQPTGTELGIAALATASDPAFAGGGGYVAFRPEGRIRIALLTAVGSVSGRTAGRGELAAHFLLTPERRRGVGLYGAAGVAGETAPGRSQGYLLLGVGLEWAPAGRSGWALEAGVAGGFRVALGWRWRQLRRVAVEPP